MRSEAERKAAEYRRKILRRRISNAVDEIIDRANLAASARAAREGRNLRPETDRPVTKVGDGGVSVGGERVVDRGLRIVPGNGGGEER